ncbi:MAG TPA: biotin transporter BioY [Spirochaetia bacterium]|nr:biotin transporter BioY [Spirochaetia bacterium]
MSTPVLAMAVRPTNRIPARIYDACLIAGFSLVIAVSAQVSIPLPFTPVPVTLQTFAVVLTGALLGSRRGAAAVLLYLAEGFAGLPVFSLGSAGFVHLLGPTGGYLIGFAFAAWITGFLIERRLATTLLGALMVLILGHLVPYIPGVAWLSVSLGPSRAFALGFLPFLVGDALKIVASVGVLTGANILVRSKDLHDTLRRVDGRNEAE